MLKLFVENCFDCVVVCAMAKRSDSVEKPSVPDSDSVSEGCREAGAGVGKSFVNHRKQVDRLLGRCEFFINSVNSCLTDWPYFINRTVNAVMVIF